MGWWRCRRRLWRFRLEAGNEDKKLGEMAKQNMLEVVANFRTAATRKFLPVERGFDDG